MVYVTHDQEEAMTLGTRVAVMRDGVLEQVAPALEVFRRPANVFVAGFVGSPAMNLWRCSCTRLDAGLRIVSPAFSIDVADVGDAAPAGGEIRAGIRPHDIDLVPIGEGDGTGRAEIVERLGPMTVVHLRTPGMPKEFVRVVVPPDMRIEVGDQASFRVRRDRLHLFDDKSERRVN